MLFFSFGLSRLSLCEHSTAPAAKISEGSKANCHQTENVFSIIFCKSLNALLRGQILLFSCKAAALLWIAIYGL